ncbi:hypothetical protein G9A89_005454 [Geosiphon pyriformis]|nr:hypothetical protein G9A89_005454 [Geosiphon pyriformis]
MGQALSTANALKPSFTRRSAALLAAAGLFVLLYNLNGQQERQRQAAGRQPGSRGGTEASVQDVRSRSRRVGVDARFLAQMKKLLPICIPGDSVGRFGNRPAVFLIGLKGALFNQIFHKDFVCEESRITVSDLHRVDPGLFQSRSNWKDFLRISVCLDFVTLLFGITWNRFSGFNGHVVKAIVSRDRKTFLARAIVEFGYMMWPMSVVNNSLKMCISALALSFRKRLTRYAHEQYLKDIAFYKISHVDNRIQNPDQLLTQDIDKFAENLSHLFSDIGKPLVDIILFAWKLGEAIGREAPIYMITYFLLSGSILRAMSPPFRKLNAIEQKFEGDFRFTHSRIMTYSEEIAFYGGGEREKSLVNSSFDKILRHVKKIYRLRFANGILDSVLYMGKLGADPTKIMEDYSRNSGYLVNLSQAVGRLILAGRDLPRFAGYASRISELFEVLEDVNKGRYERTISSNEANITKGITPADIKGRVIIQDSAILFDHVPIITPNHDVLIKDLSFKVEKGMNCLIMGPNGCGKSSLFRILGDLWPLFDGTVKKPSASKLFYVPQKPYLALGTLRDQIIYPDTKSQARSKGYNDEILLELLNVLHFDYIVEREGWDSVRDWTEALMGSEKQRVAMARLFYHKPQFAILDECTSVFNTEIEGAMYRHARELGITLLTVSHRQSLFNPLIIFMDENCDLSFNTMNGYFVSMAKAIMNSESLKKVIQRSHFHLRKVKHPHLLVFQVKTNLITQFLLSKKGKVKMKEKKLTMKIMAQRVVGPIKSALLKLNLPLPSILSAARPTPFGIV